jgi:hypothetical protein
VTMDALTRCPTCLRLSEDQLGRCIFDDCTRSKVVEDRARFLFTCHGYRLTQNQIWVTVHDEPELGWEGIPLTPYTGTFAEAYRLLMAHRFPTGTLQCVDCHDVDVAQLGDRCDLCSRQAAWV